MIAFAEAFLSGDNKQLVKLIDKSKIPVKTILDSVEFKTACREIEEINKIHKEIIKELNNGNI